VTPESASFQGGGDSTGPALLAIDTTGSACSVAASHGAAVIAAERQALRYGHAEALLPMIDRVVQAAGLLPTALDGVAVAVGPGGFTGIRVGLGAAHGIALALRARLIGVTSFAAVVAGLAEAASPAGTPGALLVALDSRRDDLYVQLFDSATAEPFTAPAAVLPEALADYVAGSAGDVPLLIAGDLADAAAAVLRSHFDIAIAAGSAPDARGVLAAALRQIERDPAGSPARPLYLRPPDVTLPKRRGPVPAAFR
jgi:tRNA threonylcarbamoyladenosine biosynthesis protein TsaB